MVGRRTLQFADGYKSKMPGRATQSQGRVIQHWVFPVRSVERSHRVEDKRHVLLRQAFVVIRLERFSNIAHQNRLTRTILSTGHDRMVDFWRHAVKQAILPERR